MENIACMIVPAAICLASLALGVCLLCKAFNALRIKDAEEIYVGRFLAGSFFFILGGSWLMGVDSSLLVLSHHKLKPFSGLQLNGFCI